MLYQDVRSKSIRADPGTDPGKDVMELIIPGRKGLSLSNKPKSKPRKGSYGIVLYLDVRSKSIRTDPRTDPGKDVMGLCYTWTKEVNP